MKKLMLATAMVLGLAGISLAQTSANVTVTATVLSPISITATTPTLAMGNVAQNTTTTVSATSGSAAQLTVSGQASTTFTISWNTDVTLTDGYGSNPISFTPALYGSSVSAGVSGGTLTTNTGSSGTISVSGTYYISVGGSINPGSAPTGSYSTANLSGKPLTVTVAY